MAVGDADGDLLSPAQRETVGLDSVAEDDESVGLGDEESLESGLEFTVQAG